MDEATEAAFDYLMERAVALWGRERAEVIRESVEGIAEVVVRLRRETPGEEEDPAFYL